MLVKIIIIIKQLLSLSLIQFLVLNKLSNAVVN
jgi:hypothetical protein